MGTREEKKTGQRIIAIGDIHGCSKALAAIISAICPAPGDTIIPMGDYVDRGPDSRGVLDQLVELSKQTNVVPLLGNHEIMMLMALEGHDLQFWFRCGGAETIDSYGGSIEQIPEEHLAFVRQCRRYYETAEHLFVHANYQSDLSLQDQPDDLLFWTHISYYIPPRHVSGKTAIVGHTPQPTGEILDLGHLIGIDTYCFGTGWLTALDVETGDLWQADKHGILRAK